MAVVARPIEGDNGRTPMTLPSRLALSLVASLAACSSTVTSVPPDAPSDVSLDSAVEHVLRATRGYRHPEPTRRAHDAANELRRRTDVPTA